MFEIITATLALSIAVPVQDAAHSDAASGLITVPSFVDLGTVAPGATVHRSVWIVNTSWQPATITAAQPNCGCTTVPDFAPMTLAPGAARSVEYVVNASKKGDTTKTIRLAFLPEWGDAVELTTTIATSIEATVGDPAPPVAGTEGNIVMLAETPDLGMVIGGAPTDTSVWIINASDHDERIARIKAGCGCTKVLGFEPTTLAPGSAQRVRLRITPSTKSVPKKTVTITAHVDGREPLKASVGMQVEGAVAKAAE